MNYKRVCVTWNDAWYDDSDYTHDEKDTFDASPYRTQTVGFLIQTGEQGVLIAHDMYPSHDGKYKHNHFIPAGMIESVKELVEK